MVAFDGRAHAMPSRISCVTARSRALRGKVSGSVARVFAVCALALAFLCAWCQSAYAQNLDTMYRLYNPWSGEHLYTNSTEERDALKKAGWLGEGVGWFAPAKSNTPVYRLYNPFSGDHHYTLSKSEYDTLGSIGWQREGTGWYSDDAKSEPLYRVFNPYVVVGTHHYTTSIEEYESLGRIGWNKEGIAWYGSSQDGAAAKCDAIINDIVAQARNKPSTSDMLTYVAERVGSYAQTADFVMSGAHYDKPVDLLVYNQSSCAGAAATCAEVLSRLGYGATHVNRGKSVHNWCEVTIAGTTWIVEGEAGFAARKSQATTYPNGVVTTTRGETFEFRAAS